MIGRFTEPVPINHSPPQNAESHHQPRGQSQTFRASHLGILCEEQTLADWSSCLVDGENCLTASRQETGLLTSSVPNIYRVDAFYERNF